MRRSALAASVCVALSATAWAAPPQWKPTCADHSCKSRVRVDATGARLASATPNGVTATDIQASYHVDPTLGAGVTVAVIDAYGYKNLEADLAVYRSTFGMPPCTIASGCLTIVNDAGQTSPLPADDPDWIVETALDVDMVSTGCPACKIIVVQASAGGVGLDVGQATAIALGANTISNSWGGPEFSGVLDDEPTFDNPGVGTFSGGGDGGYDAVQDGEDGPVYPSTSLHVIAVGGTTMTTDASPRGHNEVAWRFGGSSCSVQIAKPSYQPANAACTNRAATDISAVADGGSQGIAIYVGGWTEVDGTSAASPVSAAMFAASGHGDAVPAFVYRHPDAFLDITSGTNGSCGTNLCNAGPGWDGPTGLGTPDVGKLAAIGGVAGAGPDVAFVYPAEGATVAAGFTIQIMQADDASYTEIDVDGVKVKAVNAAPFDVSAPAMLADGAHEITAIAYDLDHNSKSATLHVTQHTVASGDDSGGGGCAAGGNGGAGGDAALVIGGLALAARRRRRAAAA